MSGPIVAGASCCGLKAPRELTMGVFTGGLLSVLVLKRERNPHFATITARVHASSVDA